MRIPCPHCGPRDHAEFTYGGDAAPVRPEPAADAEAWQNYVYLRTNPRGRHAELWHHTQGCRLWLRVERDTVSHVISAVDIVGAWAS